MRRRSRSHFSQIGATCLFSALAGHGLIITAAGHAQDSGAANLTNAEQPAEKAVTPDEREPVLRSFASQGVGDEPAKAAQTPLALEQQARVIPAWDRPAAQIPAELAASPTPNYYVYDGRPVMMNVDRTRLAVRLTVDAPQADAGAVARDAGVEVLDDHSAGAERWRLLTLQEAALDDADTNAKIEALRAQPEFEFVSPVFENPEVAGGWLTITQDVLVRLNSNFVAIGAAVLTNAAPEFQVVRADFGKLPGAYVLRADSNNGFDVLASVNRLAQDPRFAWAEPDVLATMELHLIPNDPGFSNCWGIHNTGQPWSGAPDGVVDMDMDGPEAWEITRGNSLVRVLVMDTGTQQNHPDINQVPGRDFTNGLPAGFGNGSPLGACDNHGTAVAGTVSAIINNNLGTVGIAPGCDVMAARIASQQSNPCSSLFATYSSSWVVNALSWGEDNGADVTNASFGVSASAAIEDEYAATYANGVMHFASAGNNAIANLSFPSEAPFVNSVAALDPDGTLTSFSSWGAGLDFSAPGIVVYTTDRTGASGYASGDYTYVQGTSFSSPYAAGVAALLRTAFPDYPPATIELYLRLGAMDLGVNGYDTTYGWGFINAWGSLIIPGPANNFCATATPIFSHAFNPAPYSTTSATAFTTELQENCEVGNVGVSNSVWYRFQPSCDGTISINTNGSDYDTVLSIWVGSCSGFAALIACDDDAGVGLNSQLNNIAVNGGSTYLIKVADYDLTPEGGMLDFNFVYDAPAPANDTCLNATEILASSYNPPWLCTVGATNSICENNETCEVGAVGTSNSVWYEFTPPCNGNLDINTNGSDYDTVLSVWTGCGLFLLPGGCNAPTQIACDDDAGAGLNSQLLNVPVVAGTTYKIKVSDYDTTSEGGNLDFNFVFQSNGAGLADINCDGVVNVNDLLLVVGSWGACPAPPAPCPADIAPPGGDGIVNVNDLLLVVGNWS